MMENERHVLVIFPHPDDEAFGVSGTIASSVSYTHLTLPTMAVV